MGDLTEFPTETEFRAVFDDCANGDEWLTMDEFTNLCYRFYLSPTTTNIKNMFKDLDKDGNEKLSYEEVKVLVEKQWCPMEERKNAFESCLAACRTKSGPIDREELKQILSGGDDGDALTDEDIEFIFNKMDLNGDQKISEKELVKILFELDDGAKSRAVSQCGKRRKGRSRSRSKGRKRSKSRSRSRSRKRSGSRGRKHSRSRSRERKHSRSGSRHRKRSRSGSKDRRKSRSRSSSGHKRRSRSRSGSGRRRRSRSRSRSGHRRKSRSASRERYETNERHNEQNFMDQVKTEIEQEQKSMEKIEQATDSVIQETQQDTTQQDATQQDTTQPDTTEQKQEETEQKDETSEQKVETNEQKKNEDAQVTETTEQKDNVEATETEAKTEVEQSES